MKIRRWITATAVTGILTATVIGCKTPKLANLEVNRNLPQRYSDSNDTLNSAKMNWSSFFNDAKLDTLISIALKNNQEMNITLQEIEISKNEIRSRKGDYLPSVGIRAAAEVEKVGRYTSQGANDANTDIKPGTETPDPLPDFAIGAFANWEVDVWGKLRNAKKSAVAKYLASAEGRNFMVTNLIAEIAESYYELLSLDSQMDIVKNNIELQTNALRIVKLQKESARVTELAVKKFEAELYKTQSLEYDISQKINETENKINFLVGRFPQPVERNQSTFEAEPKLVQEGIPTQLLENRPDIREAELQLVAAKLDVKSAKANFYPSLGLSAGIGLRAFKPSLLTETPESLIYRLAGELTAPLINRNTIKALYYNANAKQLQAVYQYDKTVLNAYREVANQLSQINNLKKSYELKRKQVEALTFSIRISNDLFASARADYMEVLLTQRDALEAKFELVTTKKEQMDAVINTYRALGGGWRQ